MGTYDKTRGKKVADLFQAVGSVETPDSTEVTVLEKDSSGLVLAAKGTTVPTNGEAGYAKGATFLDTDVTAGSSGFYENVGTTASCQFVVVGSVLPPESITGTEVLADATVPGPFVARVYRAVYDFSVDGGAQGAISLDDADELPSGYLVFGFTYNVITTCTSATDAATVSLTIPTDGDLIAAVAISNAANPWDAGAHAAGQYNRAAVTTAARTPQVTVATEDLTAGKIEFTILAYKTATS